MEKLHVSAYSGHLQVLTTFLLKELYIICLNRVVMLRSTSSFYVFLLSYIWWDVYWVNEFVGSWVWIFAVR